MLYKAEFENNEIEIFEAENDIEAFKEASKFEKINGIVYNIFSLDEEYNILSTVY